MVTVVGGPQQGVACLRLALPRQVRQQKLGERHSPLFVGLGSTDVDLIAGLDRVRCDASPLSQHVQINDPQADSLAPPQAGIGQKQDQPFELARRRRQPGDLLVAQVYGSLPAGAGQLRERELDPARRRSGMG